MDDYDAITDLEKLIYRRERQLATLRERLELLTLRKTNDWNKRVAQANADYANRLVRRLDEMLPNGATTQERIAVLISLQAGIRERYKVTDLPERIV